MTSVELTGDIDLASTGRFEEIAQHIGPHDPDLDLDLSGVTFMDSSGLNMLTMLHNTCQAHGGVLTLRAPSERVQVILKMTALDAVFTVEP